MKDIKNKAAYESTTTGVSFNKGKDVEFNEQGFLPQLMPGSKNDKSTTTKSAISDGNILVRSGNIDLDKLNRDTLTSLNKLDTIFDKTKIEERQELARLFAKDAFNQLHNWKPKTANDKLAKDLVHGIVAELTARIAGNKAGNGFYAGATNEALAGKIFKISKENPAVAQWLSAITGTIVNKASGKFSLTGASVAQYGTKWNSVLANKPGEYAFYSSFDEATRDQERYVSSEIIEISEDDKNFLTELEAFTDKEFILKYRNSIPFAAPVTYAASQGQASKTFSLGSVESDEMAKTRALRDEVYAMLAFNGTGDRENVNVFSKRLVFDNTSIQKALDQDGPIAAVREFGAALAFHRATFSMHATQIASDNSTITYYVYGFVGDKFKFRESDTEYTGVPGVLNALGAQWQKIGAIKPTNIYVEFQMEVTVPR